MGKKPIELMRRYYGESNHLCGECCNLMTFRAGKRTVRKCKAYGATCSSKSDWAKKWGACGLFGKDVPGKLVSDTAKKMFSRIGVCDYKTQEIDGQQKMEGYQANES